MLALNRSIIVTLTAFVAMLALSGCNISSLRDSWRYMTPRLDTIPRPTIDVEALAKKHPDAPYVFLGIDMRLRDEGLRGDGRWFHTVRSHRYVVLDEHNEDATTIDEGFNNNIALRAVDAFVWNPDGTTSSFVTKDFVFTRTSDDGYSIKLAIPGLKRGSIVDYAFVLASSSAILYNRHEPIYLKRAAPVEQLTVKVEYPIEETITHRSLPEWMKTSISKKRIADGVSVSFTASNIPARKMEPYRPTRGRTGDVFEYAISSKLLKMSSQGERFWEDLRDITYQWGMSNVDELDIEDEDEILRAYEKMVKGATSATDTLQQITNWIRKNVRIVNNAGYTDPDEAFEDKASDIWGYYSLYKGLVQKAGFQASVVKLHDADKGPVDLNFLNMDQFSDLALYAVKDRKQYIVLPHYRDLPVDVVYGSYVGEGALIVDTDRGDVFTETINPVRKPYHQMRSTIATVKEDGAIVVEIVDSSLGSAAYGLRQDYEDLPESELQTRLKKHLIYNQDIVTDVSTSVENLKNPGLPLILKASYTISTGVAFTPEEVVLQTEGLFANSSSSDDEIDSTKRVNPIFFSQDYETARSIELRFPSQWKLVTALSGLKKETELGSVERTIDIESGKLRLETLQRLKAGMYPSTMANQFFQIYGNNKIIELESLVFSIN